MGVIQVRPSVSFRPATHEEESQFMSLQELAITASLVHHGMHGEVNCKALKLWNVIMDLSSIPHKQLGSLAACVTDDVFIGSHVTIPDLKVLLDKVMSENLFICRSLGTDETLALVRAMQTRVKRVSLHGEFVDNMALRTYDGKGRCEEVRSIGARRLRDSIEIQVRTENIRRWAQSIDWDVTEDSVILLYGPVIKIERR